MPKHFVPSRAYARERTTHVDVSRTSETGKKKKLAKATETNGLAEIANNLLSPLYERMQNEEYVWSRCWKWKIELDHDRYNMSEEVS